jgi:hypothetical protein
MSFIGEFFKTRFFTSKMQTDKVIVPPLPQQSKQDFVEATKAILEFQEIAPSPSQTLYHISVCPSTVTRTKSKRQNNEEKVSIRDRMKTGCVILRDWPRKRMSQAWRRGGLVNPSEKVITFQDFYDGELKSNLVSIFGQDKYNEILEVVKIEITKENRK